MAVGCASSRPSSKTCRTSEAEIIRVVASRPIRFFLAGSVAAIIVSPAAVVAAVVWNVPPLSTMTPPVESQPFRQVPPPDVGSGALPNAPLNVYANDMSGVVPCPLCNLPPRVYVPNSDAGTVDVIDPLTFKVIDHYVVGQIPHHITPAWDMRELYVEDEGSSTLTVIDIHTGKPRGIIHIPYPYNLYFTPDGTKAIDVVEREMKIDFFDPHSWKLLKEVPIPWPGADHMDFSADGSYLLISTEYSGVVAKVDVVHMKLVGYIDVGGLPIDIKLSPDGKLFYVTNQGTDGVSIVDPVAMKVIGFLHTGRGAHGLQVSRDARSLYVSNRLEGSISIIDFATRRVSG